MNPNTLSWHNRRVKSYIWLNATLTDQFLKTHTLGSLKVKKKWRGKRNDHWGCRLKNIKSNLKKRQSSCIVCIGISTTPQKHPPPPPPTLPPLKSENCPPPPSPLLGNFPPIYWFFSPPPLKIEFSVNSHNIKNFHLNHVPSHLLNVA